MGVWTSVTVVRAGGGSWGTVPALPPDVSRRLSGGTGLESRWVWLGLAGAAVLCAAALGWWCRARPLTGWRRATRRALGGSAVAVLAVAAGGAGVNSYVGYFPSVGSLFGYVDGQGVGVGGGAVFGSRVVSFQLGAPRLGVRPARVYVYLPPGYGDEPGRRYPVVYLLPGFPGRSADWFSAGDARDTMDLLVRRGLVPPMLLVSADEAAGRGLYDSECLDAVGGPAEERFLTGTLVSYVDTHFRTVRDRGGRTVAGMSSGGFCALNLGLRHTAEYSGIGAVEPFGDPGRTGYAHLAWRHPLMWSNTPAQYIPAMRFAHRMAVLLDVPGLDQAGVGAARYLATELARRGQQVALRVEPGQSHTWRAARAALPYILVFAATHHPSWHRWQPHPRRVLRRG
jgi:S-formylglutathione hydrolase FrmB